MSIDEELLLDDQETQREIAYIREQLPAPMDKGYADELLSWMLDAIATYYYESGILESTADEVDVDMDEVARFVCAKAEQELARQLDRDEVRLIAEADLDFQEQE
jgi:hypothetical protein